MKYTQGLETMSKTGQHGKGVPHTQNPTGEKQDDKVFQLAPSPCATTHNKGVGMTPSVEF